MAVKANFSSIFFLAGVCGTVFAQTTAVDMTGVVTDSQTGKPVAGAAISLTLNPSITTTTDTGGNFHLVGQAAVPVLPGNLGSKSALTFAGNDLGFNIGRADTHVDVSVFDLGSRLVRNVLHQNLAPGKYNLSTAALGLPAGIYFLRARVGAQSAAFKISSLGGGPGNQANAFSANVFSPSALSKSEATVIDTLKVAKTGYVTLLKPITEYNTYYPIIFVPGLPPGNLKIYSDQTMNQIPWGTNVDVQVWDGGTQLQGSYAVDPYEGPQSWLVTFSTYQAYSAWGFVTSTGGPVDLSAWANGAIHIAVKGTATSVGITVASVNQSVGTTVNLGSYGYLPDNQWHESVVPMSSFTGIDLTQVNIYCGLSYPVVPDTVFNPALFYQVDDIYYSLTH